METYCFLWILDLNFHSSSNKSPHLYSSSETIVHPQFHAPLKKSRVEKTSKNVPAGERKEMIKVDSLLFWSDEDGRSTSHSPE